MNTKNYTTEEVFRRSDVLSNVSITSIDGKNITSSENLLGGVILGVHSSREVDA
jgi:hypothetical protein